MAPRERKPALAALAVLLILLGALGATVMVMRAGNKVSVVEITQPVAAGDPIPVSAIREVMLSDGTDLPFIKWRHRNDLLNNYRAATNLVPNSVLVESMITKKDEVLPPGKALVGLSLKDGQFPEGLQTGDTVAAYQVGNSAAKPQTPGGGFGSADPTLIGGHLIVKSIGNSSNGLGSGDTSVTVLADSMYVARLTIAASANEVALVRVAQSKN
ncbi:hypothetical protein [Streptomyces sp.]|uniref:hypothetical protein n=1 Tax=Streptomyces sp. TaxID=1931 RepID=UPI002F3E5E5C